jgi:GNAT superfamily N-acetyltransferase
MKTKDELVEIIKEQLSLEYNCSINDFSASKNIVTVAKNCSRKRHYINGVYYFQMVTFGNNVVINANECIHEWLTDFIKDKTGYQMFEQYNLFKINNFLKKHKKQLGNSRHMFISDKKVDLGEINIGIKWFEQDEINQFYENKLFSMALCDEYDPECPDILAVAGYDDKKMIGMAGCTADTSVLSQISIEVDEKYRGKRIGSYLVVLLKNELEKRGRIPLYGTSLSNINSWKTALRSGFSPEWIEITT